MNAAFPESQEDQIDSGAEKSIKPVFDVIGEVRKIRSELKINPGKKVGVWLDTSSEILRGEIKKNLRFIYDLAGVENIELKSAEDEKGFIKTTTGGIDIYIYILEAVDIGLEIKRIKDELKKNSAILEKSRKKLENPEFIKKAPEKVINKEKGKLEESEQIKRVLQEQLDKISKIKK
jgi:valyl-tRNA synthetase